jgi:predicted phage terminase large subunit-like protein
LQISPQAAAQELLARREARKSLIKFTEYTNPSYEPANHHRLIAEKLEAVERGEIDRLMIFMPPRHGKSELASRRFPAWYVGRNPDKQIIAASYNSDLAGDFGREVRNIVDSPEYGALFQTQLASDSKAANRWHTDAGGMYVAAGVGTAITGRGAHVALIDDPLKDREEADSEVIRDKVYNWYTSTLYTRLMPGGAIVLIQTRWHDDDLAGRLLAESTDNWEILELPATADGEALWPEWYPIDVLDRIKANLPPRDWNSLYQQNPIPDDGLFFKKAWFNWYDRVPRHLNVYITHDDAVTDDSGDFTEIGVWGVDDNEDVYALDWWSGQTTADVWNDALIDLILKWSPFAVVGETGPIRRAVEPFLLKRMQQRKAYCRLEWLPTIGNKPARARAFQGLASMGKVHFPNKDWAHDLLRQLLRFPAGVLDDKVDACGLVGRVINQTWAAKVAKKKKKIPLDQKPTLNEMIRKSEAKPKARARI